MEFFHSIKMSDALVGLRLFCYRRPHATAPGIIDTNMTGMTGVIPDAFKATVKTKIPLFRSGTVAGIARACLSTTPKPATSPARSRFQLAE